MANLHPDIESALKEVLAESSHQSAEFKRRLRKLIENAMDVNVLDSDIKDVVELATVDVLEEN